MSELTPAEPITPTLTPEEQAALDAAQKAAEEAAAKAESDKQAKLEANRKALQTNADALPAAVAAEIAAITSPVALKDLLSVQRLTDPKGYLKKLADAEQQKATDLRNQRHTAIDALPEDTDVDSLDGLTLGGV